jgi:hypothetical protein
MIILNEVEEDTQPTAPDKEAVTVEVPAKQTGYVPAYVLEDIPERPLEDNTAKVKAAVTNKEPITGGIAESTIGGAKAIASSVKEAVKHFNELPTWSKYVSPDRVSELAEKYNATPQQVEDLFAMRGALVDVSEQAKMAEILNATQTGDGLLDFLKAPNKDVPKQFFQVAGGMANSLALNIPWKLLKDSEKFDRNLMDEVEKDSEKVRGKVQRLSETIIEFATGAGAVSNLMKATGVSAKYAQAVAKAQQVAGNMSAGAALAAAEATARGLEVAAKTAPVLAKAAIEAGAKAPQVAAMAGKAAAGTVGGALKVLPTGVGSGIIGAGAGYGSSEKGEELSNALKYGAAFAAFPYIASGGAKLSGYVLAKPVSAVANMLGQRQTKAIANFEAAAQKIEAQAADEKLVFELAMRKKSLEDISPEELAKVQRLAGVTDKQIALQAGKDATVDEIEAIRKATVRGAIDSKLYSFASEYIPPRTNLKLTDTSVNAIVNEFAQFESADDIIRYMENNKQKIPLATRKRVAAVAEAGDIGGAKDKLMKEWFLPKYQSSFIEETGKFLASAEDVRNYVSLVNKVQGKSDEFMDEMWKGFRTTEELQKQLKDTVINYKYDRGETYFSWAATKNHVLDMIDRRFGINDLSFQHNKLMKALDKFKTLAPAMKEDHLVKLAEDYRGKYIPAMGEFADNQLFMFYQENSGSRILKRALEKEWIPEDKISLANAMIANRRKVSIDRDTALKMFMPEKEVSALQTFSKQYAKTMEDLRQSAASLFGVKMDKVQNYFRHQLVNTEAAILNIVTVMKEVGLEGMAKMSKKEFRKELASNSKLKELQKAVRFLYNSTKLKAPEFKTAKELIGAIDEVAMAPESLGMKLSPQMYSAYQRTGGMPVLLRELDPIKVADSWVDNTLRAAFTREPIANISKFVPILEKLGATSDAEFLRDYVRNAMGRRADALFNSQTGRLRRIRSVAERFYNQPDKYEQVVNAPSQVATMLTKLLQSQLLSSPFTAMRNLEQLPFMAATEIGGLYGQRVTKDAMADALIALKKGGIDLNELYTSGRLPAKWRGEIHDSVLAPKKGGLAKVDKVVDAYSNVLMWIFGKGETLQRIATIQAGKRIAADALAGVESAVKFTENVSSPAWKRQFEKSLVEKNAAELGEKIGDYLIDRTMFHYTKQNMSRVAEFLGPMLSMFTRYSTEVSGDIMSKLKQGQAKEVVEKYLYPVIYVQLMWNGLKSAAEENDALANRLAPVMGTSKWMHTPAASVAGFLDVVRQPPVVTQAVLDALNLFKGDSQSISKAFTSATNILPGIRPAMNWVDNFYSRLLLGMDKDEVPVKGALEENVKQPIVEKVSELFGKE